MDNQFNRLGNQEINPNEEYYMTPFKKSKGFTILMKYSLMKDWTSINKYFNGLLKLKESRLIKLVINQQNEKGWTPLMMTCCGPLTYNNVETVKLLLENGADTNLKNSDGDTALMLISNDKSSEKFEELFRRVGRTCEYKSSIYPQSNDINNSSIVTLLLKYHADVNLKNNDGHTALMMVITLHRYRYSENMSVPKLLLHKQSDINLQDNRGFTALMIACIDTDDNTSEYIIKFLLDNKADVNLKNNDGCTALTIASSYSKGDNNLKIISMLVDSGADVNAVDVNNRTAFRYAFDISTTSQHNVEILKLLLSKGAKLDLIVKSGMISIEDIVQGLL